MATGSMKAAAGMLSVSQPAVSKIIKTLEDDLGLVLFVRRKGGLQPGEAAIQLLDEVERSYAGLVRVAQAAEQIRARRAGILRIAAMSAMSLDFLPQVVAGFLAARPDVSVVLDTHNSPDVVAQVRMRHYDLGVTMAPIDGGGIEAGPTRRVRCVCVLPASHRLARRRVIEPQMLRGECFISLSEDSATRTRIDHVFAASAISRDLKLSARAPATVCAMVRAGLGVAVVSPFAADQHARLGGVVRPFEPLIDTPFVCVRPAGAERSTLSNDFMERFDEAVEPYLT